MRKSDFSEFLSLYLSCFTEDDRETAVLIFDNLLSKELLLFEERNGRIASMLSLIECTLFFKGSPKKAYYLYAACTAPEYRGLGLMGSLLKKAEKTAKKNGICGILLKPAEASLFDFYKNFGYKTLFFCNTANLFLPCDSHFSPDKDAAPAREIPISKWIEKRDLLLPGLSNIFVQFNPRYLKSLLKEDRFFCDEYGNTLWAEKQGEKVTVKEILFSPASSHHAEQLLLSSVMSLNPNNAKGISVSTVPSSGNLKILKNPKTKPFGMFLPCLEDGLGRFSATDKDFEKAYLGIAFD